MEKRHLRRVDRYVMKGMTIADVRKKFQQYSYNEILSQATDHSLRGKQQMVTFRLNKLERKNSKTDRKETINEIKRILASVYANYKKIGKSLANAHKITR